MNVLRRWFRLRCRKVLGRGPLVFSYRNPDRIESDGSITDGVEIAVYGSITCGRWRFHLGEHRPPEPKPCVPISCPPIEEHTIEGTWTQHEPPCSL